MPATPAPAHASFRQHPKLEIPFTPDPVLPAPPPLPCLQVTYQRLKATLLSLGRTASGAAAAGGSGLPSPGAPLVEVGGPAAGGEPGLGRRCCLSLAPAAGGEHGSSCREQSSSCSIPPPSQPYSNCFFTVAVAGCLWEARPTLCSCQAEAQPRAQPGAQPGTQPGRGGGGAWQWS